MILHFLLIICVIYAETLYFVSAESLKTKNSLNFNEDTIDFDKYSHAGMSNNPDQFTLTGFEKVESVSVIYPKDICVFKISEIKFAAALNINKNGSPVFSVHKHVNGKFIEVYELVAPLAVNMDCRSMGEKAYVALVYNLTETMEQIIDGSPVFEITLAQVSAVQFFNTPFLSGVFLRHYGKDLFMMQTFSHNSNSSKDRNSEKICPIFKWSGYHFDFVDGVPCINARQVEPFTILSDIFVTVLNYADTTGNTETFSFIYKFDVHDNKFVLHQKLKTSGAKDVKYFTLDSNRYEKDHFLVIANSIVKEADGSDNLETSSIIYKYISGRFVPFQQLLFYSVSQFLPVESGPGKFLLLVACEDQELKILQYDGWLFVESGIQFTEGSMGKGVSNMRTYHDDNQVFIVIANSEMLLHETNIFIPRYIEKENIDDVKQKVLEWSNKVLEMLMQQDIDKLNKEVQEAARRNGKDFNLQKIKTAAFQEAYAENVYVKQFENTQRGITNKFWQGLKFTNQILNTLEEKINDLEQKITLKFPNMAEKIPEEIPENLTKEDYLDLEKRSKYAQKNREAAHLDDPFEPDFNGLEKDSSKDKELNQNDVELVTDIETIASNQSESKSEKLIVADDLKSGELADVNELKVENLSIKGLMNGIDFMTLTSNLVKNNATIKIQKPISLKRLKADHVVFNGPINKDFDLSKLVLSADGATFAVDQDIQFAQPIFAKSIKINERLNNINVNNGRLDVLLLNSPEPQTIHGNLIFESVALLEPISLQGKIKSPSLEKMNPVSTLDGNIVLQGDYEISGNVTVKHILAAGNIYDSEKNRNILNLFADGVEINDEILNGQYNFTQPITTHNSDVKFCNNVNVGDFVIAGTDDIQILNGHKTFVNDVQIRKGYCEATEINRVNIDVLNKTVMKKSENQIITGKIHFKRITASNINAQNSVFVGETNLQEILTTSTEQNLTGRISANSLVLERAFVHNLSKFKNVFNVSLEKIFIDSVDLENAAAITGNVHFKNLTIENLYLNAPLNHVNNEKLVKNLIRLNDNNLILKAPSEPVRSRVNVLNLSATGNINGVAAGTIGKNWLLTETDQGFTAPQTISKLSAEEITLNGYINDRNLKNLIEDTYWLNKEEHLDTAIFEKDVIAYEPVTISGLINDFDFANNVIVRDAKKQYILGPVEVDGDVTVVGGKIIGMKMLNDIDLPKMLDLPFEMRENLTLLVQSAVFENSPRISYLNGRSLKNLKENLWYADKDTLLSGDFHFGHIQANDVLEIKGPVNEFNLEEIAENYFSLSRPQDVHTALNFKNSVRTNDILVAQNVTIDGIITDLHSKKTFDIEKFTSNVLLTHGDQEITGLWNIYEANIVGNLNNISVNNLKLLDDVVRYDVPYNNISGTKYIEAATIDRLFCEGKSLVNDVDMSEWIARAIFVYDNYTIQGNTTIQKLNLYNNANVLGKVNGIEFNANNLLLRSSPQIIKGNVDIVTKYSDNQRISPLSFKNLHTNTLNGIEMNEFFNCLVKGNHHLEDIKIDGKLIFTEKLIVDQLIVNNDRLFDKNTEKYINERRENFESNKFYKIVEELKIETMKLTKLSEENRNYANQSCLWAH